MSFKTSGGLVDFGRIENFQNVDYELKAWNDHRQGTLNSTNILYLGLPLWNHESYLNKFIPPQASKDQYLFYYAKAFNSIELNTTYYSIPSVERVESWVKQVEEQKDFIFCPKLSKSLLSDLNGQDLNSFFRSMESFGEHLGQIFLQFTPQYDLSYADSFKTIIQSLPKGFSYAVELRHPSWFSPAMKRRFSDYLRSKNISWVITDTPGNREVCHMQLTSEDVFIRFVGNSLDQTDFDRLDDWVIRLKELSNTKRIFFFLHQPIEGDGVELLKYLQSHIEMEQNLLVRPYKGYNNQQLSLFD